MPVTFVIGRAGSGKTFRCLDRICRAAAAEPLGRPIWLVVPKQATFQTERDLVARLGAFARVRVVHLEQLGETVLAEVGGVAVPQVTAAGRRMLIGRLLYRLGDQLTFFGSSARRPGLAGSIDALFDEFERSGRTLDELGDLVDQLAHAAAEDGTPSLHAKLADLRLLYREYAAYVGADRLDPHRRREQVLAKLAQSDLLRDADVYVDGFYEFTDNDRRVLAALAAGTTRVEVSLTVPPESPVVTGVGRLPLDLSPFHRTERAYLALRQAMAEAGARIAEPELLPGADRFEAEPLGRIERLLFAPLTPSSAAPAASVDAVAPPAAAIAREVETPASPVVFVQAADPRAEVRAVARRIGDLLRQGCRQRDVLVLARDADEYVHLIHTAFAEHGLTYFADRRRPATHHPLVRLVRAAVRVAREGFPTAAVMAVAKTGLAGISQAEADRLENYLVEHRITAAGWTAVDAWAFSPRATNADEEFDPADAADEAAAETAAMADAGAPAPRPMNAVRDHLRTGLVPLAERLGRTAPPAPLRTLAAELFATLERFGVRHTLAAWIAQDHAAAAAGTAAPERAEEHEQVWRQLVELFEQMVNVLGDERVMPAEFAEILETGLDAFDLAIAPPTVDQVLVGSVDRTRPPAGVRAVFVLGLNRGSFPFTHRDASLLSGSERYELQRRKVDIDPAVDRRQLDERFLAYVAFTRGRDKLIVSRPLADAAGRATEPSDFWAALRAVVPEAPVVVEAGADGGGLPATAAEAVSRLLAWAREIAEGGGGRPVLRSRDRKGAEESNGPVLADHTGFRTEGAVDLRKTPLAYFLTFTTCGTWFHGDDRGSADREHNLFGTPYLIGDAERERRAFDALKRSPISLDEAQRRVVRDAIAEVCAYRGWRLHVVHVRPTHVHVVVTASEMPERLLVDFKSYGTRRLRAANLLGAEVEPWTRHGSTRFLFERESVRAASEYVHDRQGIPIEPGPLAGAEMPDGTRGTLRAQALSTPPLPDGHGSLDASANGGGAAVAPATTCWRRSVYNWLARRPAGATAEVDRLARFAWPSLSYANAAELSPAVADRLFPSPLVASAGQLESMAACPFQHFLTYGLRLAARGGGDVSALDLSELYHETLAAVVNNALAKKQDLTALPHEQVAALAKREAAKIAKSLRQKVFVDDARGEYLLRYVGRMLEMILATLREQLGRGQFAPFYAEAKFGPNDKVKSPEIALPGGKVLRLRGKIDRVDRSADGALAVHDYRMGDHRVVAAEVHHGLSLRLLVCLMVLDRAAIKHQGRRLVPAAALCARLLRWHQRTDHPEEALLPASAEFRLAAKPRGVIRASHVKSFDTQTEAGQSPVVAFWINKDGTFGRREAGDVAEDDEFRGLLDYVEHKVAELAGQVVAGRVAVEPYLYQDASPCVRCGYRKVCRFEPSVNRYRKLESLSRADAVTRMREAVAGAGNA
jgi:ATP-dependent helicase/DNAse subunit B/REP element-mobilizing transposase RayT